VTFDGVQGAGVADPFGNFVTPYEVTIHYTNGDIMQLVTCYDIEDDISTTNPPPPLSYQELSIDDVLADGLFKGYSNAYVGYESIGWLESQTYAGTAQEIGLQYAIWDVFGKNDLSVASGGEGCASGKCLQVSGLGSSSDPLSDRAAYDYYEGLLTAEIAINFSNFNFNDTVFLEPATGAVGGTTQPFVFSSPGGVGHQSSTPEPSTLLMIGSGLLCLLSSLGFRRLSANRG
jgi:hypothetical protein